MRTTALPQINQSMPKSPNAIGNRKSKNRKWLPCGFPCLTSCASEGRFSGVFRAPRKNLKNLRETPCAAGGVLVYYSPVAPNRANPERRGKRSLTVKALQERDPAAPIGEPSEGTRNTRTWKACCDARSREGGSTKIDSYFSESLILAQNERWQRGLGMQVERDPEGSNTGR